QRAVRGGEFFRREPVAARRLSRILGIDCRQQRLFAGAGGGAAPQHHGHANCRRNGARRRPWLDAGRPALFASIALTNPCRDIPVVLPKRRALPRPYFLGMFSQYGFVKREVRQCERSFWLWVS